MTASDSPRPPRYRGRFAPTPSGPLHLGSLLTAVLSYLDARASGGEWCLRIDDLDSARIDPAHSARILAQLEAHGLEWDGAPYYQSAQRAAYAEALEALQARGRLFGCDCTRRRLKDENRVGAWGPVYAGRCRERALLQNMDPAALALRLHAPHGPAVLHDDWQPPLEGDWQRDVGDVVLRRRDGVYGYALASAIDEQRMGITHVVRGADLLSATLMHWAVLDALGHPRPRSRHGPLLLRADGAKLSKQNHAEAIDEADASAALLRCCAWLGLSPDGVEVGDPPSRILQAAVALWRERRQRGWTPPQRIVDHTGVAIEVPHGTATQHL